MDGWVRPRARPNVAGAGYVNVPSSASIDSIVDQVTIAGWGNLSATGTIDDYATIASREEGTTIDQHYHISINSRGEGPAMWLKTETVTMLLEGPTPVARQTWVHIAGTYDGSMARLYLNGQQVDSKPITGRFVADTTPFIIGANGNGNASAGPNVSERFPAGSTRSCSTGARSAPPRSGSFTRVRCSRRRSPSGRLRTAL